MSIHPTAVIDPSAKIGKGVQIGPFCLIGPGAEISDDCTIGAYTQIDWTRLGPQCKIGAKTILGGDPQMHGWTPVESWVTIGAGTFINEMVVIHRSKEENKATSIGPGCYIMTQTHVGHDCTLGADVTLTSLAGLAGHVEVGDRAVIGGALGIHQFVRIGTMAMVGGMSRVSQDVAPYFTVAGIPARAHGLNAYAMKKYKTKPSRRKELKHAYKLLVRSGLSLSGAMEKIREELSCDGEIGQLIQFIDTSERGIIL